MAAALSQWLWQDCCQKFKLSPGLICTCDLLMWPWVWIGLLVHTRFCGHQGGFFSPWGSHHCSNFKMRFLVMHISCGCYDKYYSFIIAIIVIHPLYYMKCACLKCIQKLPRCLNFQLQHEYTATCFFFSILTLSPQKQVETENERCRGKRLLWNSTDVKWIKLFLRCKSSFF